MKPKGKPQRGEMFVELAGNKIFLRCSAPEQEMELLMFLDQVEIKLAVTNFVELQEQQC
jgi:hypothetical protein